MSEASTTTGSFVGKSSQVEDPDGKSDGIKLPPSLTLTPVANNTAQPATNTTTSSSAFMISPPIFRRSSSSGSSTSRLLSHPPLPSPSMLLHENNTPTPVIVDKLLSVLPDTPFHLNPFDEAFKHSTRILTTSSQVSHEPHEDALHTPKLNLIPESPKLVPVNPVTTLPLMTKKDPMPSSPRKIRPIAPLKTDLISEVSAVKEPSSAQLLLKFPTGESIHLSDMPVVLSTSTSSGPSISDKKNPVRQMLKKSITRKRGLEMADPDNVELPKKKSQISGDDEEKRRQILERNRAAAQRSRNKKRHEVAKTRESMDKYKSTIREVMAQNERLKMECQWLKSLLEKHLDCSVTKALNQRELLEKEIGPKIVALPADPENQGQPIEIPLNLIQVSKQSKAVVLVKSQERPPTSDAVMKANQ